MLDPATMAMLMQLLQGGGAGGGAGGGMGGGSSAGGGTGFSTGLGGQSPYATSPGKGWNAELGPGGAGYNSKDFGVGLGKEGFGWHAGDFGASVGPGGISVGSMGEEDSIPGPQHVFKKLMRKNYPVVSQSADRLAGISMREASRGANAAGMGNSAVLQSIRDAAFRSANEEKSGARDQFLQQAFDIVGAKQKAAAFQTMMQAAQQRDAGGQGGGMMGGGGGGGGGGMLGGLQGIGGLFGLGGANKPQEPTSTMQAAGQVDAFLPGETEEQRRRRLLLSGTA